MLRRKAKLPILLIGLLALLFSFGRTAQAASQYDQNNEDGTYFIPTYGSVTSWDVAAPGFLVNDITVVVDGNQASSGAHVLVSSLPCGNPFDLYDAASVTGNGLNDLSINLSAPHSIGCIAIGSLHSGADNESLTGLGTSTAASLTYHSGGTVFVPKLAFNGGFAGQSTTNPTRENPIVWQNPPFKSGFTSSDFLQWQTCVFLDLDNNNFNSPRPGDGYQIYINYGTSTAWSLVDRTDKGADHENSTTTFYTIFNIPTSGCKNTSKYNLSDPSSYVVASSTVTPLPPGQYFAQAGLYLANLSPNDPRQKFIASTTVLSFNILTTGSNGFSAFPTSGSIQSQANICQPTSWQALTVDWGLQFCRFSVFMFYPSQDTFNLFGSLWTTISVKPPFGYFQTASSTLGSITDTGAPTTTPLAITATLGIFVHPIDYALSFLAVLSFAFWLFYRLKHMEF